MKRTLYFIIAFLILAGFCILVFFPSAPVYTGPFLMVLAVSIFRVSQKKLTEQYRNGLNASVQNIENNNFIRQSKKFAPYVFIISWGLIIFPMILDKISPYYFAKDILKVVFFLGILGLAVSILMGRIASWFYPFSKFIIKKNKK